MNHMTPIRTFFRPDGTEFRCRADVYLGPVPAGNAPEPVCVVVVSAATARKFRGGETYGMGRFAPVRVEVK